MKSLKKKLLLLFFGLGAWTGAMSQDVSYVMRVTLTDGTFDEYLVADHPTVALDRDKVMVYSASVQATYDVDDVKEYTFVDADVTSIEEVASADNKANISVTYVDGKNVIIRGISSDTPVRVYSLNGQMQNAIITSTTDGVNVSLAALPTGTYIIDIKKEKSIKVLKR